MLCSRSGRHVERHAGRIVTASMGMGCAALPRVCAEGFSEVRDCCIRFCYFNNQYDSMTSFQVPQISGQPWLFSYKFLDRDVN
jgi:hypothetical protein